MVDLLAFYVDFKAVMDYLHIVLNNSDENAIS